MKCDEMCYNEETSNPPSLSVYPSSLSGGGHGPHFQTKFRRATWLHPSKELEGSSLELVPYIIRALEFPFGIAGIAHQSSVLSIPFHKGIPAN